MEYYKGISQTELSISLLLDKIQELKLLSKNVELINCLDSIELLIKNLSIKDIKSNENELKKCMYCLHRFSIQERENFFKDLSSPINLNLMGEVLWWTEILIWKTQN